jgi:hypothetical protein
VSFLFTLITKNLLYNLSKDISLGIWNGTEATAATIFLAGGGEDIELSWNLGTMVVDGVIDYFKK